MEHQPDFTYTVNKLAKLSESDPVFLDVMREARKPDEFIPIAAVEDIFMTYNHVSNAEELLTTLGLKEAFKQKDQIQKSRASN
jgi:hypothetical protein